MKKALILLSFILAAIASFSFKGKPLVKSVSVLSDTFINKLSVGSPTTLYYSKGGIMGDSALVLPKPIYADTTAANFSRAAGYSGSLIQVAGGQIWYRVLNPNKWVMIEASGISGITSLTQGYGSLFSSNPITTTGTIGVDTTTIIPYTDTLKINGIATKSDIRNSPSGTVTNVSGTGALSFINQTTTPIGTIDTSWADGLTTRKKTRMLIDSLGSISTYWKDSSNFLTPNTGYGNRGIITSATVKSSVLTVTGTALIGGATPLANNRTGSFSPLEINAIDAGIAAASLDSSSSAEGYYMVQLNRGNGVIDKAGVLSVFYGKRATAGYDIMGIHASSHNSAGVQKDNHGWAYGGGQGFIFFPPITVGNPDSTSMPSNGVVRIYSSFGGPGSLIVDGTITNTGLTGGSAGDFVVNGGSGLLVTRTAAQAKTDIGAVGISDTASMLSNYLRKSDTTTMLSNLLRKSDTTTMLSNLLRKSDTLTMLAPYLRGASNGLTASNQNVILGGLLTQNTTITDSTFYLTFDNQRKFNNSSRYGLNGNINMYDVQNNDNTQLIYAGTYGSMSLTSPTAVFLYHKGMYAGVNGTIYFNQTGNVTGSSSLAGLSGWNLFANTGNISNSAGLHIKTPDQQAGMTAYTGKVTTYGGVTIDNLRDSSTIQSKFQNMYAINQKGAHDTSLFNGIISGNIINATTLGGTLSTASQPNITAIGTQTSSLIVSASSEPLSIRRSVNTNDGGLSMYTGGSLKAIIGLAVGNDNIRVYNNTSGNNSILVTAASDAITLINLAGTGSRTVLADASGVLSAPVSDSTVKKNLRKFGYGINEVMKLTTKWGEYKDGWKNYGEGRQNFLIAQNVKEVIPEAVFRTPTTGKLGINKDQLDAVYVQSLQDLQHEFEFVMEVTKKQQKEIDDLKKVVKKLQIVVERLQK